MNQLHIIESHLEQALKEENAHNPKDKRNSGVAEFYKNKFPELYQNAKAEYETFQKRQKDMVKTMREHHEYIFSTQKRWEEALRNGDPAALCD